MIVDVSTDKLVYDVSDSVSFRATVRALRNDKVRVEVLRESKVVLTREYVVPLSSEVDIEDHLERLEEGFYEVRVTSDDDSVSLPFAVLSRRGAGSLVIVFHNHQPLNKRPDGTYHSPWAFEHVWSDEFSPYFRGGAYLAHAHLLDKFSKSAHLSYNLSPSLLMQWRECVEQGVLLDRGDKLEYVHQDDERARLVRLALETYKRLSREGTIEVLTSFLAHPIAGYVIESLGWTDIIEEELAQGRAVTEEIMGVRPRGLWLPEMFFSMKLVPMLVRHEIEYTVLDGLYHFSEARGDKSTIYEVYEVEHDGFALTVLFRDTRISNLLSFTLNKARRPVEAKINARTFVLECLKSLLGSNGGVLTVALDGENWMVLPRPNPETFIVLSEMLSHLSQLSRDGYLRICKVSDVLRRSSRRRLSYIPSTSWLGSCSKWTTERAEVQSRLWSTARLAYQYYKAYREVFGDGPMISYLAHCMMNAIDSDMYWTEFINEEHVYLWSGEIVRTVSSELSKIRVAKALISSDRALITIRNDAVRRAHVHLVLSEDGGNVVWSSSVSLDPGENVVEVKLSRPARCYVIELYTPERTMRILRPVLVKSVERV